jgi:hydrogenase maturation protein HypF
VKYALALNKPGWDLLDLLHKQIESQVNAPPTSSMGRLFDAVAALIGVRQTVNYEAQGAIELEYMVDPDEAWSYPIEVRDQILDPAPLLEALLGDLRAGVKPSILAARFHNSIAEIMRRISIQIRSETGINEVALSGGVWQNMTLLKKSVGLLRKDGFKIYLHHQVPTNDGGIALGQAAIALHQLNL